jgi:hypothetical protein
LESCWQNRGLVYRTLRGCSMANTQRSWWPGAQRTGSPQWLHRSPCFSSGWSVTYWYDRLMVNHGSHKSQGLWSGWSDVVHPPLLESANGSTLIGGN